MYERCKRVVEGCQTVIDERKRVVKGCNMVVEGCDKVVEVCKRVIGGMQDVCLGDAFVLECSRNCIISLTKVRLRSCLINIFNVIWELWELIVD